MDIMIYDSTGPLQGSTGWYLMVLGQLGGYWLYLGGTGSV